MPSVTLHKIVKEADGRVRLRFGKREREFSDLQAMRDFAEAQLTPEVLEALVVALALKRQPALGNPSAFEGRTLNVDLTLANWGTLS
jgi:hypothetical protein